MRRRGMHIGYWWESQMERDQKEVQYIGGCIILKWVLDSVIDVIPSSKIF
jgi:hypothetical protein